MSFSMEIWYEISQRHLMPAGVVAMLIILGILSSISLILALYSVLLTSLLVSIALTFFNQLIIVIFFNNTIIYYITLCFFKSVGTGVSLSISNLSTLLFKLFKSLVRFLYSSTSNSSLSDFKLAKSVVLANLVPSPSFWYKRKAEKRPWNTSNTWLKLAQIEGIFFRINYRICGLRYWKHQTPW